MRYAYAHAHSTVELTAGAIISHPPTPSSLTTGQRDMVGNNGSQPSKGGGGGSRGRLSHSLGSGAKYYTADLPLGTPRRIITRGK